MNDKNLIPINIKQSRVISGLSQKELAGLIGVSDKTISAYETGRATPPTFALTQIAKVTNVSVNKLLGIKVISETSAIEKKLDNIEKQISYLGPSLSTTNKLRMDAYVGVVLMNEKKELYLIKEEDKNAISKNRWNLPGGSVDQNEDFVVAAIRETYEKTGYKVKIKSLLGCYKCSKGDNSWIFMVLEAFSSGKVSPLVDRSVKKGRWFTEKEFYKLKTSQIVHPDMHLVYRVAVENRGLPTDTVKLINYY